MPRIALDDTPFYGRTSRPVVPMTREPLDCSGCGSSLVGRAYGLEPWGGRMVKLYRRGCGRGRRVKVPERRAA